LLRYLADPLGIEREVSFDLRNSGIWILVGPHRVDRLLSSSRNTVVTAIAFVRTVGGVICLFQLSEINVLTRNVLNGGIVRFPKGQCVTALRNHTARNGHDNASRIALDGDRVIWTWNLNLLFFHVLFFFWNSSDCQDDPAERAALN